jgi:hypothetical protein
MDAEEMQIIDRGERKGIGKRKSEQIRNGRVKADCADGNRDRRRRGFNYIVGRRDVPSRDQQGEIVRCIVLQTDQLGEFDYRESAEQQSHYNCKTQPTTSWAS